MTTADDDGSGEPGDLITEEPEDGGDNAASHRRHDATLLLAALVITAVSWRKLVTS